MEVHGAREREGQFATVLFTMFKIDRMDGDRSRPTHTADNVKSAIAILWNSRTDLISKAIYHSRSDDGCLSHNLTHKILKLKTLCDRLSVVNFESRGPGREREKEL